MLSASNVFTYIIDLNDYVHIHVYTKSVKSYEVFIVFDVTVFYIYRCLCGLTRIITLLHKDRCLTLLLTSGTQSGNMISMSLLCLLILW